MSSRDAEVVARLRRAFEAYSRGDFDSVMEIVDPEVELVRAGGQSTVKGATRFRAWMEPDAFDSQVIEPLDFRVVGNKVLVRHHNRIRGAGSGIEAEFLSWTVWTLDDAGLVTRIEVYLHHQEAEALEAAGLSE
jgi:ketosteroid isomerase-like protein